VNTSEPLLRKDSRHIASPLVIFGASGHGKVVIDAARAAGLEPEIVVDDAPRSSSFEGIAALATGGDAWEQLKDFRFVVAVGNNAVRQKLFENLCNRGGAPETIIHPFSCVAQSARIGAGTVVLAGAIVNAGAEIGENCILNTGCRIDHDCRIGSHAHICPGVSLAGAVSVGARSMIGIGSCSIQGMTIGSDVTVGAGSVIVKNLPDHCVAYGNPALPKRNS
jgi:sugar O-acyltransferase (sialic acid O-acetyltransferase NeuD family)